jgi:hypothetical protein
MIVTVYPNSYLTALPIMPLHFVQVSEFLVGASTFKLLLKMHFPSKFIQESFV